MSASPLRYREAKIEKVLTGGLVKSLSRPDVGQLGPDWE